MALPTLIYFGSRGRAELLRLLLAEAGVEYTEENFKGADQFNALKASGRLPFGQVPVWEEDGFRLAQSVAIQNHLARRHGLHGKTPRDEALVDQAVGACEDVRQELRKLQVAEPAKRAEVRAELVKTTLPRWFKQLETVLKTNKNGEGFVVGNEMSLADLAYWYEYELATDHGFGAALADCPTLRAHAERIGARPRLSAYRASSRRPALVPMPA